jgi:hypothetical protein
VIPHVESLVEQPTLGEARIAPIIDLPALGELNSLSIAQQASKMSRCTEIADGRLRVFKYLSRFKTNVIAF